MNQSFSNNRKPLSPYALFLGAIAMLVIGFTIGVLWLSARYPIIKEPEFRQLSVSYNKILDDFLEGAEPRQLINGAAEGMLASLNDPYSQYMVGEAGEAYTQSFEDKFYGIGAEMRQEEGDFIITSVIKDTPAERGGLQPGDMILAVDGTDIQGKSFQELLSMIRGEENTKLTLRFSRPGEAEPLEISLKRAAIPVHTVTSEMLEGNIGHVTISRFANETAEEFKTEIEKLKKEGELKGLLLDLRSNPGGLLHTTIEIADMLIPNGKTILNVVYKNERSTVTFKSRQQSEWTIPIVVLVNEQSASASEVLSSALKESADAIIIGKKTYGKGVVQQFRPFPDGSVLSLTEAQWKTPAGTWINKEGVHPDIEVGLPEYANLRPLAIGTEMKDGSYGDDVKTLQQMLLELGYGPIEQLGVFDSSTAAALKKFQRDQQLEITGAFNDKTGYRILELLREKLKHEDSQLQAGQEKLQQLIAG